MRRKFKLSIPQKHLIFRFGACINNVYEEKA